MCNLMRKKVSQRGPSNRARWKFWRVDAAITHHFRTPHFPRSLKLHAARTCERWEWQEDNKSNSNTPLKAGLYGRGIGIVCVSSHPPSCSIFLHSLRLTTTPAGSRREEPTPKVFTNIQRSRYWTTWLHFCRRGWEGKQKKIT